MEKKQYKPPKLRLWAWRYQKPGLYKFRYAPIDPEIQELIDFYTRSRNPASVLPPVDEEQVERNRIRDLDSYAAMEAMLKLELKLKKDHKVTKPPPGGKGCKSCGTALQRKNKYSRWPTFCPFCAKIRKQINDTISQRMLRKKKKAEEIVIEYKARYGINITIDQALVISEYRKEAKHIASAKFIEGIDRIHFVSYKEAESKPRSNKHYNKGFWSEEDNTLKGKFSTKRKHKDREDEYDSFEELIR